MSSMTIRFNNVTPAPLAGVIDSRTDVWQKECVFEPAKKYRLVAPSGKGKSTFIHYIYGLRNDYSGEVTLDGKNSRDVTNDQWAEIRQRNISIVYQDLRLFLHLTAEQNLEVKSALYSEESAEKIGIMSERLGVANLLKKKSNTLSYGERQRIAIIRALIQPFDWLLVDEPFSHLDKDNSEKAFELIDEEVNKRNAGLILTSLGQDNYFTYHRELKL
jgi:ABC-type lipoprotein export system ATPase subunit